MVKLRHLGENLLRLERRLSEDYEGIGICPDTAVFSIGSDLENILPNVAASLKDAAESMPVMSEVHHRTSPSRLRTGGGK